jgi:hypothetical protein
MSDAGEALVVRRLGPVRRRSVLVTVGALVVLMGPIGGQALGASAVAPSRTPVHAPGSIVRNARKARKRPSHKKAGRKVTSGAARRSPVSTTSTSTVSTTSTSTPAVAATKVRYAGFGPARPRRKAKVPTLALAAKPASTHHGVSMTAILLGLVILVPMLIVALALIGSELARRSRAPRKPRGSWIA